MEEIIQKQERFMKERGWDNLNPGDLAKSIMIEGAELLELFQWVNPTKEELMSDTEKMEKIKKELADVLIYALDLAISLNIDPKKIILEKIEMNEKKFPAEKMITDDWYKNYLLIKKEQRDKNNQ
ncbi:MAG: nucleotide pyrophosphohydrolase [Candidatus Magasanikbacteria bacterium]